MSERPNGDLPPEWDDLGREDSEALAPPAGAKERVQHRVAVTLGLGAGFVAATAASSSAAAAGAAGAGAAGSAGAGGGTGAAATGIAGTLLAKKALILGVAAAVGVGGGTAAYLQVRSERARSQVPAVMPAPTPAPVARPVAPPPAESRPAALSPDTLGEERTLLDRARQDIVEGRLVDAGALLDRHAARFPTGQLAEEREALVIRLLVREGREQEASSRAARFRQQHPRSIQLPGIDDALRGRR
ncbi:MAG TPA: hypothetical protein VGG91_04855 [Myxococcaceae bacterium]